MTAKTKTVNMKAANAIKGWFMPLLIILVWGLTLISSVAVVYTSFISRQATQELEELRRTEAGLKIESGRYMLEKSALASYSRIERIARKDLQMALPTPDDTVLVYNE